MVDTKRFFICGSALTGQPDHQNLQGAHLICATQTLPLYRLYSVDDLHPGIYEVSEGGISIPGEIYELTIEQYNNLMANEPPGLYEGQIKLEDGSEISAMLYPQKLIESYGWLDISKYGGWAAYKQHLLDPSAPHP
ncbi:MAG: gamma-glutamylcyclotransferase [Roseofilum sp. SBFL]|uniref:allophanate hydrolase-related protein n=1 Tax=unclassified Roseofilum TaxID=2620099 RepID=UPI001B06A428|nr:MULTISPECIES: gamma-glutamylcyclotransferase [unclassified Roseofilum]MBP0012404.1 gamma-glutamylcyclotransferase [Roseofilum sp. SID3]MBP0023415.1 gamma-glutamylcyclotransferase [Roseofilum sp. SID2]MBP0038719.1 gamma-glutamylcyclotransferase [Roseofilum sp. SID1]MBP0041796.1 gamma-glutamylcyclotransferase [Roseofilum sp. SBFL]